MEKALWYLFGGTRGGEKRPRLVRTLTGRPEPTSRESQCGESGFDQDPWLVASDGRLTQSRVSATMFFWISLVPS